MHNCAMRVHHRDILDRAFDSLERAMPRVVGPWIHRVRQPRARYFRIPIGLLSVAGGCLWFLPVLGAWMLPLGLLLLSQDVHVLRRPAGRLTLWLLYMWIGLRRRFRRPRSRRVR